MLYAMPVPFVILALPRSRTKWLSQFLAPPGRSCLHDLAVACTSIQDFVTPFMRGLNGTVETGAVEGWSSLMAAFPKAKFVVVRRPVEEVLTSLAKFGISNQEVDMLRRARLLDHVSSLPGVHTVTFKSLEKEATCAWLYEHCLELPHNSARWKALDAVNVQIDMQERIAKLAWNAERIAKLKSSVTADDPKPQNVVVTAEPFASIYPECEVLGRRHFNETDEGVEPRRQWFLQAAPLELANRSGYLRTWSARQKGQLVGYIFWHVLPDVESGGMLIANQGAWFVSPSATPRTARLLWDRSIADLKAIGVQLVNPHHRMQGRGAQLGKFFIKQGAKPIKQEYSLWIGG